MNLEQRTRLTLAPEIRFSPVTYQNKREERGIQNGESDEEVLIHRCEELLDAVTLPVLSHYSLKDSTLKELYLLVEKGGKISDKLKGLGFGESFTELSVVGDGILLHGNRFVISKKLKKNVLQAAHEGHPGRDSILRNLRQSVWWPGLSKDVTEMVEGCIPCQASEGTTVAPKMMLRETPRDIFEDVSMEFKGPVAGEYYIRLVIDNLSCYPVVQVVKSTNFSELKLKLDKTFTMFGIPVSNT